MTLAPLPIKIKFLYASPVTSSKQSHCLMQQLRNQYLNRSICHGYRCSQLPLVVRMLHHLVIQYMFHMFQVVFSIKLKSYLLPRSYSDTKSHETKQNTIQGRSVNVIWRYSQWHQACCHVEGSCLHAQVVPATPRHCGTCLGTCPPHASCNTITGLH